jgi:hypothetical protein
MVMKLKLFFLRIVFILATTMVIWFWRLNSLVVGKPILDSKVAQLAIPMIWLRHYLLGSGRDLSVPEEYVVGALDTILVAYRYDNGHIYHSTCYKGSGFYNRPLLFYLVGGFTFGWEEKENGDIAISGVDHYDWHSTETYDGGKEYFTSPFYSYQEGEWDEDGEYIPASGSGFIYHLWKVLSFLFGEEYFPMRGFPSGDAGISNRLWEDMKLVGAKEFDSHVELTIPSCVVDEFDEEF